MKWRVNNTVVEIVRWNTLQSSSATGTYGCGGSRSDRSGRCGECCYSRYSYLAAAAENSSSAQPQISASASSASEWAALRYACAASAHKEPCDQLTWFWFFKYMIEAALCS